MLSTFKELKPEAGKDAKFVQVSKEEYKAALAGAGMPPKAQEELYENMAFMHDFGYYGKASLEESHAVSFFPFFLLVIAIKRFLRVWGKLMCHGVVDTG